jgi:phosphatidate cytidylyltransferase
LLGQRIVTGLLLGVAVTATMLMLPTVAAMAVLGILWVVGAWEWAGLARLEGGTRLGFFALCVAGMAPALLGVGTDLAHVLIGVAACWWVLALLGILSFPRRFPLPVVAIAGLLSLIPSLVLLSYVHGSGPSGPRLAFCSLVIVWAADVGAYAFGRWLGRHKLAPSVSPGKTWEGLLGGMACAAVVAAAAAAWVDIPRLQATVLGVVTALVSVVGDLTVSMFKRNVGLKDSGKLLPGHGGALDRIDSLTAAVPLFALGLLLAGVIS